MQGTIISSDSLVSSLCREAESIRFRIRHLTNALNSCIDRNLLTRLSAEFNQLEYRRSELLASAKSMKENKAEESLEISFLIELINRK